jgi:hypothetical protein
MSGSIAGLISRRRRFESCPRYLEKSMKVAIIAEVDLETGEYEVTFRNRSNPGGPMDLELIKAAFRKVAEHFGAEKSDEGPANPVLN